MSAAPGIAAGVPRRTDIGKTFAGFLSIALLTSAGCRLQHGATLASPGAAGGHAAVAGSRPESALFADVTERAGIRFRHTNGGFGRKYMPETMGSGCAFLDFDGDGWLDILLLNGKPLQGFGFRISDFGGKGAHDISRSRSRQAEIRNPKSEIRAPTCALYRNNGDGTFTDVTRVSGLDVPMYAMGCCVGDYDNDGREDIFITTCLGPNHLFHNEGGGRFRDVTQTAGVADRRWGTSCSWVDYDNDGWLDLFVCNYVRFRTLQDDRFCSLVANRKSYCPPTAYEGEACALYHNNHDGTFSDVSQSLGIAQHTGDSLGVSILDFDGDGWMDIAVANDETPNYLFHNIPADGPHTADRNPKSEIRNPKWRARRFEEIGVETGFAVAENGKPKAGMGIDAADYFNNGSLGILVSNFSDEGLSFYRQEGSLFLEESFARGFGAPSLLTLGFGLFFFDYDNDGLKDAFVANGHINDDIQLVQSNVTYRERSLLFHSRGDGSFEEVGRRAGPPFAAEQVSRGAAYGDFDNDGRVDLLVTNNNGPAKLLRNIGSAGHWLEVEVRGRGPGAGRRGTNVSGIGARLRVKTGKTVQTDWVRSGSSYLSQSMLRRHFGLGSATHVDWVEVTWTTGERQRFENVPVDRLVRIEEGRGLTTMRH